MWYIVLHSRWDISLPITVNAASFFIRTHFFFFFHFFVVVFFRVCKFGVVLIFKSVLMLSCVVRDSIFSNPLGYIRYIIIIWMSIRMDQINYLFICRCCVCWMLNKRFTIFKKVSHLQLSQSKFMTCCMSHASSNSPALIKRRYNLSRWWEEKRKKSNEET